MARPRKNRIAEYAGQLAGEVAFHLGGDLERTLAAALGEYRRELDSLRAEIGLLRRQIEVLARWNPGSRRRVKVGRWVPGGPGRPPKDAEARIAAIAARARPQPSPRAASGTTPRPRAKTRRPSR